MREFFFDTANVDYIRDFWNKTKDKIDNKLIAGVTTNPNAFYKVNKLHLSEWFEETTKLCELITEIRQDDLGVVYIQCPNSEMEPEQVIEYAKTIQGLSDGHTKVGLKIPPFEKILKVVDEIQKYVPANVTGVADSCTALKALSYPIRFMSIIPGRMEEVGINAKAQIAFINQSNNTEGRIITGSMRTIEQVIWTFQYKTVPTIGERVLNLILEDDNLHKVLNIDYGVYDMIENCSEFSPSIEEKNLDLSLSFFNQMDELGKVAHKDYNGAS